VARDYFAGAITVLATDTAELNTPESPVLAVDHSGNWSARPPLPETMDWVHPDANGDRKIAARWFEALEPISGRNSAVLLR
jgi:lysophospholipase L1-like esterase